MRPLFVAVQACAGRLGAAALSPQGGRRQRGGATLARRPLVWAAPVFTGRLPLDPFGLSLSKPGGAG
ncbi:hypothetical protein DBR23_08285 [Acidovorax sp. HMWF018]|nr:hypothetical protein DBR23_08285 [Acidovorax sp. HMWF018]